MITFNPGLKYRNLPMVVLAGRPNVGKSTLFNRLLRKRRSITDPTPGVTRDSVEADAFIAERPLRLVDTGGYKLDRSGDAHSGKARNAAAVSDGRTLDDLVVDRTLQMLEMADLIVLVLEAGEFNSEDEEFIELLRRYRNRLLVAVNKTEGGRREAEAWNVLKYGFSEVLMISAEHGDHIGELENAIVRRLDFSRVEIDDAESRPIRIALLGKPNTGKSTLSNRLTSSSASIVSEIPGTTRDVVEGSFVFKDRVFHVLDTAGIRRKSKVHEDIEYYSVNRAIKTLNGADLAILLIDAVEGLSEQDKKIAALAHEQGRGIIMALNKWDTMPKIKNAFNAAQDRIRFLFGQMDYAPIVPISALDGTGVNELLETAVKMYRQLNRRTETVRLNQALEKWLEEYPPPIGPSTRFKIRYATQVSANPVKFVFFASRPDAVKASYESYLMNKVRKDLGYSMIPVQVELRKSNDAPSRTAVAAAKPSRAASAARPPRSSSAKAAKTPRASSTAKAKPSRTSSAAKTSRAKSSGKARPSRGTGKPGRGRKG